MGGSGTNNVWGQRLYVVEGRLQRVRVGVQHHDIFQCLLPNSLPEETDAGCHSEPHTEQGLRGTGGRGGKPPLPSPSLGCFSTHLSETSVDSDEVGHGRAVEGTGGRYMP